MSEAAAPPFQQITRYPRCDILANQNDIEPLGFDKDKTETEMIALAIQHGCPIIIRNGKRGKWYLKGKGKPMDELKQRIQEQTGNARDGVFCLLIE
jgi:hypothetical protein